MTTPTPTLPAELEIERSFTVWEKSFHIRPCEIKWAGFTCGHPSAYLIHAQCMGCDEEVAAHLCPDHTKASNHGLIAVHFWPCGWLGFTARVLTVEPIR